MQKADFNCTFVFYIPTFPNSLSRHRISLWPPGSSEGNEQPVAKVSLPMGLLPPDTVSFHLLNWKQLNPASFCDDAWEETMGSRDTMQKVGESINLSREDHCSCGEGAAEHLLMDGREWGSSSFSQTDVMVHCVSAVQHLGYNLQH